MINLDHLTWVTHSDRWRRHHSATWSTAISHRDGLCRRPAVTFPAACWNLLRMNQTVVDDELNRNRSGRRSDAPAVYLASSHVAQQREWISLTGRPPIGWDQEVGGSQPQRDTYIRLLRDLCKTGATMHHTAVTVVCSTVVQHWPECKVRLHWLPEESGSPLNGRSTRPLGSRRGGVVQTMQPLTESHCGSGSPAFHFRARLLNRWITIYWSIVDLVLVWSIIEWH